MSSRRVRAASLGVGNGDDSQPIDPREVGRVTGIERKPIGQGDRGDHGVIRSCGRLAACPPQRGGNLAEGARRIGVERHRIQVGFGLLEVRLARGALPLVRSQQRADRKLGQRDRRDQRLAGEDVGIGQEWKQDKCWYRGGPARRPSQARLKDVVEIRAQSVGVHGRQFRPALQESRGRDRYSPRPVVAACHA